MSNIATIQNLVKTLIAGNTEQDAQFGWAISANGSYVIVGARYEDVGAIVSAGTAYIFYKDEEGTNNWGQVKRLIASDPETNAQFGFSVAIDGDYAVVGANGKNEPDDDQGATYIFYRNEGGADNWGQVKKIVSGDTTIEQFFGTSVSISGSYVFVGAYGKSADLAGNHPGTAYMFYKDEGGINNWGQKKKIFPSDRTGTDYFGTYISIDGNYAVGTSYLKNNVFVDDGAAYIFYKDKGGVDNWGQLKKIVPSDPILSGYFGSSVSISNDIIAIGSKSAGVEGIKVGVAYIFYKDKGGIDNWGQLKKIVSSDHSQFDNFGSSISVNKNCIVVGAKSVNFTSVITDAGAIYVFNKDYGGLDNWGEVDKIFSPNPEKNGEFGFFLASDGDYIVVGASKEDPVFDNEGRVYIYQVSVTDYCDETQYEFRDISLLDYYKAKQGELNLTPDKWYINEDERHAFIIYSDYDPLEDV